MNIINLIKRAFVGDQTTGRYAWQGYNGLAPTNINSTGAIFHRGPKATSYAGITPGPTYKPLDPLVTGNPAYSLDLNPLSDNRDNRSI